MIAYRWSTIAVLALAMGACQDDPTGLSEPATLLASVAPAGGVTGVDPATTITVEFTHGMLEAMEQYMALHEGDVTGPLVPGTWMWSVDRTRATFRPTGPLKAMTRYTIHLGGGMQDADGHAPGFDRHGPAMGGQWVTGQMMSGGMMGETGSMMGPGWRHSNGSYGMLFAFTTA